MTEDKKKLNLEELKKELEICQKQKSEYLTGWQRARADFLNYKKEERERIEEILKYTNEELIFKILPILDNFYLIETKLPEDIKKNENVKGILQIKNQIIDLLKREGVEELKIKVGDKFDPNYQEAVETTEKEGIEPGIILEITQKGYIINGRLLRPAKVKVSK